MIVKVENIQVWQPGESALVTYVVLPNKLTVALGLKPPIIQLLLSAAEAEQLKVGDEFITSAIAPTEVRARHLAPRITVSCGAQSVQRFDLVGRTIGEIRRELVAYLPRTGRVFINKVLSSEGDRAQDGDQVSFDVALVSETASVEPTREKELAAK